MVLGEELKCFDRAYMHSVGVLDMVAWLGDIMALVSEDFIVIMHGGCAFN